MPEPRLHRMWLETWGVGPEALPTDPAVLGEDGQIEPLSVGEGMCHFRPDKPCPLSREYVEEELGLPRDTARAVGRIYELCGKRETHASHP